MTNLPQVIERVSAGDFQTIAKFIPPQEVGGTMAVSANEKALVINGGRVVDMFSGRSRTVPSYAEVVVASLRDYHMVFGFGDCSRSPYNREPAMIHVPDLPEIEASNGEILRSMTVAVRFSLIRDDRSNIEKLLALNAVRRDAVTVRDVANALALPSFISATFASVAASDAESIRFDKRYTDAVRQQILMAANMALGEYGISASAAALDIYATSRDAPRRLTESQREELAKHNSRMTQLDGMIEAEKRRLELENLSNQREKLRTATMKHLEEQSEIQSRIGFLDSRPPAEPSAHAPDGYADSPSASNPTDFWLHEDDAEITLHKGDCAYVARFANPSKWKKHPTERLARNATILPIRGCRSCNPLPGDPSIESLSIHEAIEKGFTQRAFELVSAGADVNGKNVNGGTPLLGAALLGRTEVAQALMVAGADIHAQTENGATPLHAAAAAGHTETAQALIAAGADTNVQADNGITPLYLAIGKDHIETAQALIAAGADINVQGDNGITTPLHLAVICGDAEGAQALIAAGADIHAQIENGDTPLHYVARNGHTEVAQTLIAAGADIHAQIENGATLLHVAVSNGHAEVAQTLIAAGADPNAKDGNGNTPLHIAASCGHTEVAQALIAAGAAINAKNDIGGGTPLHFAALEGHAEVAQTLIVAGADIHADDDDCNTPLHTAARNGETEVAQTLIAAGADLYAKYKFASTPFASTPLHLAAEEGHTETAKALIVAGAHIHPKGEFVLGTLLHEAVLLGYTKMTQTLIAAGVDVNAKNDDDWTPLYVAAIGDDADAAQTLIAAGADIHAKGNNGNTPLHYAAEHGGTDVAQALIAAGANANAENEDGDTPLRIALDRGHADTARALTPRKSWAGRLAGMLSRTQ